MRYIPNNDDEKTNHALVGLYDVYDPEVGLNVVDLGLLYNFDFNNEKKEVELTMTFTTEFCPMGDAISSDVNEAMHNAFPDYEVNLNIIFDPPWDFSMITEEGREYLGR